MFLIVVEDRHAEHDLRRALESARARGTAATVLTGDALLAMRLSPMRPTPSHAMTATNPRAQISGGNPIVARTLRDADDDCTGPASITFAVNAAFDGRAVSPASEACGFTTGLELSNAAVVPCF